MANTAPVNEESVERRVPFSLNTKRRPSLMNNVSHNDMQGSRPSDHPTLDIASRSLSFVRPFALPLASRDLETSRGCLNRAPDKLDQD